VRAAAAFGAATEAAVKLLGAARKALGGFHGVADVVIAQHVAGTDIHWGRRPSMMMPQYRPSLAKISLLVESLANSRSIGL